MSDDYRRRIDRALIDAENARVARLVALADALDAVLSFDRDVIDDDGVTMLRHAVAVVADLRRTW